MLAQGLRRAFLHPLTFAILDPPIFDRLGLGYDLILAWPTPPPSVGKASIRAGLSHHRTNCSSTWH